MAGSPFPEVIINAREEALSGDLNRAQKLASKALQEEIRRDVLDSNRAAINCFTEVPSIVGNPGAFTVALGVGEALVYDATGITADDSPMKVVQWAAQNVGPFANPDPVNGRVDLIVVTPGVVQTDNAVRNILLDPAARTFSPSLVPKTLSPTVVPAIVTGVAGVTPAPPAVPAGAVALFEVFVPAAAPDATTFGFVQRLQRRSTYPFTGGAGAPMCGVVRGCVPSQHVSVGVVLWSEVQGDDNVAVVDGEVFEFKKAGLIGGTDTLANPFAAPAPALSSRPYFLYLVGGRALPQAGSSTSPLLLIESTTPPDPISGRPTAALGTARGNTRSALCIGVAFVKFGTSQRQVLAWADEGRWVQGKSEVLEEQIGAAGATVTLASAPTTAEIAKVHVFAADDGTPGIVTVGNEGVPTRAPRSVDVPLSAGAFPQAFDAHATSSSPLVLGYRVPVRHL